MKHVYLTCIGLMAVAMAAALVRSDQPAGSAAEHVPQIAVVRTAQVSGNCAEAKQLTQSLQARANEMNQEQTKKEAEIKQLLEQLSQLKAGSDQWLKLRDQIDDKRLALDVWGKKMQLELDRRQKAGEKSIYDHVTQAVQTIAEKQHLDLVLADSSPDFIGPNLDGITPAQFHQILAARGVLFANKKADITEDVKTLVDATFLGQASTGPQNPPAH